MPTQRHSIRQYHGQTEKKARCKSQEETPFLSIPLAAQEVKGQPTSVYLWQLFSISLLHSRLLTLKNHSISQICLIGQLFVGSSISITFSLLLVNLWGLMPELSSVDGSYKHHLSEKKITCNYPPMPINFPRKNLIRSGFDCSISSNWVLPLSSLSLSSICKEASLSFSFYFKDFENFCCCHFWIFIE